MYSLTFQYFRAILCDRRSASDVTGRDNAYNYFNIKQNTMKKRVHEMELNRSSVQMVLAERFPAVIAEMFLTETGNGLAESVPADRVRSKTY